jgi:hypothetical protein
MRAIRAHLRHRRVDAAVAVGAGLEHHVTVSRIVTAVLVLCSMAATAWACPIPDPPEPESWTTLTMIGVVLLVPISLCSTVIAVMGSWDRFPPPDRIPATGIDRIARRARLTWAIVVGVLVAASAAVPAILAVAIGPFALLARAQLAIGRLRRADVRVLRGERHVVIVCHGANPIWLRASPQQVAQCAMPRATIVRA